MISPRNILRGILLKIVNYFTCVRHFSCRWYRPPVVDLNWYPRISNPYCRDIQIRRCEWTQGKNMTQSKSWIKNSKLLTPRNWWNGYPRISNLYCHDIQIWRCEWTHGKKITQSKSLIKNSKLFYMCAALLL